MPSAMSALLGLIPTLPVLLAADRVRCDLSLVQVHARIDEARPKMLAEARRGVSMDVDVSDVVEKLEAVNESIGKIEDLVDYVNATALDMLSTATAAADALSDALLTLDSAIEGLKLLPSGEDCAEKAADFVDTANKTLKEFASKLQTIPGMIDEYAEMLPPLTAMAREAIDQFIAAAEQIRSLRDDAAGSLVEVEKVTAAAKPANKANTGKASELDQKGDFKRAQNVVSLNARKGAGRPHAWKGERRPHAQKGTRRPHAQKRTRAEAMALLQTRALQSSQEGVGSSTFNAAVAAKGSSPCAKAAAAVSKANATREKLEAKVGEANETSNDLLASILGVVEAGLSVVNSTLSAALEVADVVPSTVLEPFTSKLEDLLSLGDDLTEKVQAVTPEIEAKAADAEEPLDSLAPVAASLGEEAAAACVKDKLQR
mmetsp:Transcript_116046/g.328381  ORF Transcript_116046/g.328381 Transcript_116046/m.328381 type:complete len:430 (+) Transcript_116046:97-1386(+)